VIAFAGPDRVGATPSCYRGGTRCPFVRCGREAVFKIYAEPKSMPKVPPRINDRHERRKRKAPGL
jgi:hypothetical protein